MYSIEEKAKRQRVRNYLSRYVISKRRIQQLTERLNNLKEDEKEPLNGVTYSSTPKSSSISQGSAAYLFRKEDIIENIEAQRAEKYKSLADIIAVINHLPEESVKRCVLEYKYIDGLSGKEICKKMYWASLSSVDTHLADAIGMLIGDKKAMEIINKYYEVKQNEN